MLTLSIPRQGTAKKNRGGKSRQYRKRRLTKLAVLFFIQLGCCGKHNHTATTTRNRYYEKHSACYYKACTWMSSYRRTVNWNQMQMLQTTPAICISIARVCTTKFYRASTWPPPMWAWLMCHSPSICDGSLFCLSLPNSLRWCRNFDQLIPFVLHFRWHEYTVASHGYTHSSTR